MSGPSLTRAHANTSVLSAQALSMPSLTFMDRLRPAVSSPRLHLLLGMGGLYAPFYLMSKKAGGQMELHQFLAGLFSLAALFQMAVVFPFSLRKSGALRSARMIGETLRQEPAWLAALAISGVMLQLVNVYLFTWPIVRGWGTSVEFSSIDGFSTFLALLIGWALLKASPRPHHWFGALSLWLGVTAIAFAGQTQGSSVAGVPLHHRVAALGMFVTAATILAAVIQTKFAGVLPRVIEAGQRAQKLKDHFGVTATTVELMASAAVAVGVSAGLGFLRGQPVFVWTPEMLLSAALFSLGWWVMGTAMARLPPSVSVPLFNSAPIWILLWTAPFQIHSVMEWAGAVVVVASVWLMNQKSWHDARHAVSRLTGTVRKGAGPVSTILLVASLLAMAVAPRFVRGSSSVPSHWPLEKPVVRKPEPPPFPPSHFFQKVVLPVVLFLGLSGAGFAQSPPPAENYVRLGASVYHNTFNNPALGGNEATTVPAIRFDWVDRKRLMVSGRFSEVLGAVNIPGLGVQFLQNPKAVFDVPLSKGYSLTVGQAFGGLQGLDQGRPTTVGFAKDWGLSLATGIAGNSSYRWSTAQKGFGTSHLLKSTAGGRVAAAKWNVDAAYLRDKRRSDWEVQMAVTFKQASFFYQRNLPGLVFEKVATEVPRWGPRVFGASYEVKGWEFGGGMTRDPRSNRTGAVVWFYRPLGAIRIEYRKGPRSLKRSA